MTDRSLDAIAIESAATPRVRLKTVMKASHQFSDIRIYSTAEELRSSLDLVGKVDVVFISHRLGEPETAHMISELRNYPSTNSAAIITIVPAETPKSLITAGLLDGADGFLIEPFSLDSLIEVTRLAGRLKRERRDVKVDVALKLYVAELKDQVSHLANETRAKHPAKLSWEIFREMCSVLKEMTPEWRERYFNMLHDSCNIPREEPTPTRSLPSGAYARPSAPVKRRVSECVLLRVREAIAA